MRFNDNFFMELLMVFKSFMRKIDVLKLLVLKLGTNSCKNFDQICIYNERKFHHFKKIVRKQDKKNIARE